MFKRTVSQMIHDALGKKLGKVIIVYGPRQAGKTTLVKDLIQGTEGAISFNGDDLYIQNLLSRHEMEHLKGIVGNATTIFIDEAQRIKNIGLTIKLLVDNLPVTVIASGSASFELADKLNEPLTGRTSTFHLHPLAWQEVKEKYHMTAPETALEEILRFGMYPMVHTLDSMHDKEEYLYEYLNNYLYRDLLMFEQIKKPKKVVDLLILLAHQIGKEVAVKELAGNLGISQKTVEGYLDILEKMFVLVNIRGFSRNLRKEITKTSHYYFVDVGLRNALIRNFTSLSLRNDAGDLFENWFVLERMKLSDNYRRHTGFYFWRTYDQHEIDLIEDRDGKLYGFECKWSPKSYSRPPKDWIAAYPGSLYQLTTSKNWMKLLDGE
jgi:predicted AAA+ superfamily ATPase